MRTIAEVKVMMETIKNEIVKTERSKNPLKPQLIMENYAKLTALEWVLNEQQTISNRNS